MTRPFRPYKGPYNTLAPLSLLTPRRPSYAKAAALCYGRLKRLQEQWGKGNRLPPAPGHQKYAATYYSVNPAPRQTGESTREGICSPSRPSNHLASKHVRSTNNNRDRCRVSILRSARSGARVDVMGQRYVMDFPPPYYICPFHPLRIFRTSQAPFLFLLCSGRLSGAAAVVSLVALLAAGGSRAEGQHFGAQGWACRHEARVALPGHSVEDRGGGVRREDTAREPWSLR